MTIAAKDLAITSGTPVLEAPSPPEPGSCLNAQPPSTVEWQQGMLFVGNLSLGEKANGDAIVLGDAGSIYDLSHPLIRWICLDPNLGEMGLRSWADRGRAARKPVFLRLTPISELPPRRNLHRWQLKRMFDWMAAAFLLVVLLPVMLATAVLIRLDSPGPVFFHQWRVGEWGQLFEIVKFRTMTQGAENLHHQVMGNRAGLHKEQDDPRVTQLGKWLRKYSLDELPQLFNVLRGEMSLVGPRPWALYDALRIDLEGQQRLNALPGITGAWQVEGRSNLLDLDAVNQRDLRYLATWSIGQDLKILLMTIPKVFSGFGAH